MAAALTTTQARRLAQVQEDTLDHDNAAEACQFLATLIMLQGLDKVADEDRPLLKKLMKAWCRRFAGRFAAQTADRVVTILSGGR
jgi:hypothetical protein